MSLKLVLRSLAMIVLAATCVSLRLAAQDAPSVAEAARRAREKKQAAAAKPAPVITDDNFHLKPETPDSAVQLSNPATPGAAQNAAPAEGAATSAAPKKQSNEADEAEKKAKIAALKKQIADKKESVDLLQRQLVLDRSTFYRNPDYSHDTAGKAKLDSMQADLQQQQAELAELKAKLAELGGTEEAAPPAPAAPQS